MRPGDLSFELPAKDGKRALDRLVDGFRGRRRPAELERWEWLDTFDWRIEREGARLELHDLGPAFELVLRDPERGTLRAPLARPPVSERDLAAGILRERLAEIAAGRRLLVRARVEARRETVDLLDEMQKTVCRAHRVAGRLCPAGKPWVETAPRLVIEGLRGYEGDRDRVRDFLRSELGLRALEEDGLRAALGNGAGVDPCALALELRADTPAFLALRQVLRELLRIMRLNEPGLGDDLDTEFLHDYRVALRRMRVALREMKRVLPEALERHLGSELAWLGETSGRARDLDVLLASLEESPSALAPLVEHLSRARATARNALVAEIEGERYAELVRQLVSEHERSSPPKHPRRDARLPIRTLALRRVRRRLKRVLAAGADLGPASDAAQYHALRIQAKRLRYLLELFGGVLAAGAVRGLLADLKRLQENLGELHDAHVHARALKAAAEDLSQAGTGAAQLVAIGRRVAELERREATKRARFPGRFDDFRTAAREHGSALEPPDQDPAGEAGSP